MKLDIATTIVTLSLWFTLATLSFGVIALVTLGMLGR